MRKGKKQLLTGNNTSGISLKAGSTVKFPVATGIAFALNAGTW